ncbi:unnamed protein product, partial [Symbiodinium sp. CCMP2456]
CWVPARGIRMASEVLLAEVKRWFYAQDGFADEAFAFADQHADFFEAARNYFDMGGEEHRLDWTELHQAFVADFSGRLEAFLALQGSGLEGLSAAFEAVDLGDDPQAAVMVQLMLNMADYEPWLQSMLTLVEERRKEAADASGSETGHSLACVLRSSFVVFQGKPVASAHRLLGSLPFEWSDWNRCMESCTVKLLDMAYVSTQLLGPEPPAEPAQSADDLDAAAMALEIGRGLGGELKVPVFLYGAAREDRRPLAELRRSLGYFGGAAKGEWSGLSEEIKAAIVALPADCGPKGEVDERCGVASVGA